MRFRSATYLTTLRMAFTLGVLSVGLGNPGRAHAQPWPSYAGGAQHQAISKFPSQLPNKIIWSTSVDLDSANDYGFQDSHYGSPVITTANTVIVPVKTGQSGGFRMEAHAGKTGALIWKLDSDYEYPPQYDWYMPFQLVLTPGPSVAMAGGGGTLIVKGKPDHAGGQVSRLAFFGIDQYNADAAAYNASVQIITPITSDGRGNLYFGYIATNAPNGLTSGLAKVDLAGNGTWTTAALASADPAMQRLCYNCAPAISQDGLRVYFAVTNSVGVAFGASGDLVAVDSRTLAHIAAVRLKDVAHPNSDSLIFDDSTSSPTIGPDGDVYYGTLENPFLSNNDRGWLHHFDANLATAKTPGAFGWDITPSVVPAGAVPSYTGQSKYLLLTKYNNYAGAGSGNGVNQLAVQDPNDTMTDPITGATVMKTILTVTGITPDQDARNAGFPLAVHEWCINTAAIDPINKRAIVNSEDGNLYAWDFLTNTLSAQVNLSSGYGEPYTPTLIGPDGKVYGINASLLFAVGSAP